MQKSICVQRPGPSYENARRHDLAGAPAVREAPDQSRQDEAEAIGDDACIDAMTRRIQQEPG
jgi:hypothetical protein